MTLALRFFLHRGRCFGTLHLRTASRCFSGLLSSGIIGIDRRAAIIARCIHRTAHTLLSLGLGTLGASTIQASRPRHTPGCFPICRACYGASRDPGRSRLGLGLILRFRHCRRNRCHRLSAFCLRLLHRLIVPGGAAAMGTDRSLPAYRLHDPGRLLIQIRSMLSSLFIMTKIAQSSLLLCDVFSYTSYPLYPIPLP